MATDTKEKMQLEPCLGCGEMSINHPMVAVTKDKESNSWEAFPCCYVCWKTPTNRKVTIKGHFFPSYQKNEALAHAGSSNIG